MKDNKSLIESYLAEENIVKAYSLIKKIKDESYYYYMAEAKRIEGLNSQAIGFYKKYLKFSKNKEYYLDTLIKLSSLYRAVGDIKRARKYLDFTKGIAKNNIEFQLEIAMFYRMKGEFERALNIFKVLMKKYLFTKDFQGVSYILWAIGGIYRVKGEFKKSIDSYKRSIKYAMKVNDKSLIIYSKLGLGGVLRVSGRINEAYKEYLQTSKIIDKTDNFAKAYVFCGIGNCLRQMGKYNKAISFYKKSYLLYQKVGDELDLAFVLWGVGECYKRMGKFSKAIDVLIKANKLFSKGFEPRGKILNLISLSHCFYHKGEIKKARKLYFKAIHLAKKNKLNTYMEIFT